MSNYEMSKLIGPNEKMSNENMLKILQSALCQIG